MAHKYWFKAVRVTSRLLYVALIILASTSRAQRVDSMRTYMKCISTSIEFADAQHGVLIGQDSLAAPRFVLLTSDKGSSWDTLKGPLRYPRSLAFPNRSALYCLDDSLYFSSDLGTTWRTVQTPSAPGLAISFPTPNIGFTDTAATTDFGMTWTPIPIPMMGRGYRSNFRFEDSLRGFVAAVNSEGHGFGTWLWGSLDAGRTWYWLYDGGDRNTAMHSALHLRDSIWLLTTTRSLVKKTTNNGRSWENLESPPVNGKEIVRDTKGILYTSSGMRSIDGGESFHAWAALPEPMANRVIRLVDDSMLVVAELNPYSRISGWIYLIYINQLPESRSSVAYRVTRKSENQCVKRGEHLVLDSPLAGYALYDVLGIRVSGSAIQSGYIDTSDLLPGVYLLCSGGLSERVLLY
jgi:hypothetical protein